MPAYSQTVVQVRTTKGAAERRLDDAKVTIILTNSSGPIISLTSLYLSFENMTVL